MEFYDRESFTESKFNVKYVNTVKSTGNQVLVFKSNQIFRTKRLKISRLQKSIEYKTNEQNTKYLSRNMEIESCRMFGNITR